MYRVTCLEPEREKTEHKSVNSELPPLVGTDAADVAAAAAAAAYAAAPC